ncbi:hypothetical protein [Parasitella parasitica]|uniref:Uncharacterized protein n=1 Tax=Parasitella parasitica TaxID=35722 RepID=A0A0B7N2U8_9FUNG|nr:hypothetical protein [Parasitella parasitica]
MHSNNSNHNYLSDHHPIIVNNSKDTSKHLKSLRTRLGFARFKLRNGWEKNSLRDVECFWKQRQRQLIKEIPIPRFTQQDIIDKRSYIPAPSAKYTKSKRSKSQPRSNVQQKRHPIQIEAFCGMADQQKTSKSQSHDNVSLDSERNYFFDHYNKNIWSNEKLVAYPQESSASANTRNHSISSFDASYVPNDLNGEPFKVQNSLDYLSYAIAMTERGNSQLPNCYQRQDSNEHMLKEPTLLEDDGDEDEDTDINLRDDVSPDWNRTSQLRLSLSIPNQLMEEKSKNSPASPTSMAAQTMLMFVAREHEKK